MPHKGKDSFSDDVPMEDSEQDSDDAPPQSVSLSSFKENHQLLTTSREKSLIDLKLQKRKDLREKRAKRLKLYEEQSKGKVSFCSSVICY